MQISICDLKKNPMAYDGKSIRIRGFASLEFEDFSLNSMDCRGWPWIWLLFGGDVATPTKSTINDNERFPGTVLKFNGVRYPLLKDEEFHKFYKLITARHEMKSVYQVTATLTGTFFAIRERKDASGNTYPSGFGHLGCCHLFIITAVSAVEGTPYNYSGIQGTVVSTSGVPLSGVTASTGGYPTGDQPDSVATDELGRFSFPGPRGVLHFRKVGYRPVTLFMDQTANKYRIVLDEVDTSGWTIPDCPTSEDFHARVGLRTLFMVPKGGEITKKKENGGRVETNISVQNERSKLTIVSGELLGPGALDDFWELESETFEERWILDAQGKILGIDMRGELPDGHRWRHARFGNSDLVTFVPVGAKTAVFYDKVIDSACTAAH